MTLGIQVAVALALALMTAFSLAYADALRAHHAGSDLEAAIDRSGERRPA